MSVPRNVLSAIKEEVFRQLSIGPGVTFQQLGNDNCINMPSQFNNPWSLPSQLEILSRIFLLEARVTAIEEASGAGPMQIATLAQALQANLALGQEVYIAEKDAKYVKLAAGLFPIVISM